MGPRAGLDRYGKSRPPPGFDPRTVQPVAKRYADYAIPARDTLTEVGKAAGTLTPPFFPPPFNCAGYTASKWRKTNCKGSDRK